MNGLKVLHPAFYPDYVVVSPETSGVSRPEPVTYCQWTKIPAALNCLNIVSPVFQPTRIVPLPGATICVNRPFVPVCSKASFSVCFVRIWAVSTSFRSVY